MKFDKLCQWGWYCLLLLAFIFLCFVLPINLGMLLSVTIGTLTICSITILILERKEPKNKDRAFMIASMIGSFILWTLVAIFGYFFNRGG